MKPYQEWLAVAVFGIIFGVMFGAGMLGYKFAELVSKLV